MDTFISDIIEINNDINLDYRTSKLPKFIKDIKFKKRRKKLSNMIFDISNIKILTADILQDYFLRVFTVSENNKYLHCIRIKMINPSECKYTAAFEFTINKDYRGIVYVSNNLSETDLEFVVRYVVLNSDNKEIISTTDQNIKNLIRNNIFDKSNNAQTNQYKIDISTLGIVVKSMFFDILSEDITKYLTDELNRSERITE